jgi:hypothetical protein
VEAVAVSIVEADIRHLQYFLTISYSLSVDRTTRLESGANAIANGGAGRLFDAIPDSVNAINATGEGGERILVMHFRRVV